MNWKIEVRTTLKKGILDPQGQAVAKGLDALGFEDVNEVRVGKLIELELKDRENKEEVKKEVEDMCEKLLANPVIEDYTFNINPGDDQ